MSVPRQLSVAVTSTASLQKNSQDGLVFRQQKISIPDVFVKDVEHSVQEPRGFGLQIWRWNQGMVSRDESQRHVILFVLLRTLLVLSVTAFWPGTLDRLPTRGSAITPGVCT